MSQPNAESPKLEPEDCPFRVKTPAASCGSDLKRRLIIAHEQPVSDVAPAIPVDGSHRIRVVTAHVDDGGILSRHNSNEQRVLRQFL